MNKKGIVFKTRLLKVLAASSKTDSSLMSKVPSTSAAITGANNPLIESQNLKNIVSILIKRTTSLNKLK